MSMTRNGWHTTNERLGSGIPNDRIAASAVTLAPPSSSVKRTRCLAS
ncbi:hypothetical protein [Sorangium sp. So ce1036]